MLPHFEVVVPEKEHPLKSSAPTTPVERPGVYVLQAGSYRSESEAKRVVKKLSLRGITAEVQRVAVDADVWYRVRVGPISQLSDLNRMRHKLEAANVDSLVIRVGDWTRRSSSIGSPTARATSNMITLFQHSKSRSTRFVFLLEELAAPTSPRSPTTPACSSLHSCRSS